MRFLGWKLWVTDGGKVGKIEGEIDFFITELSPTIQQSNNSHSPYFPATALPFLQLDIPVILLQICKGMKMFCLNWLA